MGMGLCSSGERNRFLCLRAARSVRSAAILVRISNHPNFAPLHSERLLFNADPFLIASFLAEDRGDLFDSLSRGRANALERRENIGMGHRRAEIRPAIRLVLNLYELRALFV